MEELNLTICIMWVVIGLVCIGLSLPLRLHKVGMNSWYGFRTAMSYRSNGDWYHLNEYAGRLMLFYAVPVILYGILALFVPVVSFSKVGETLFAIASISILMVFIIHLFVYTYVVYDSPFEEEEKV